MLRRSNLPQRSLEHLWPGLDLVVDVNPKFTFTGMHADYLLPAAGYYEKRGIKYTVAYIPYLHYCDAAVPPVGDSKDEWEIFWRLAQEVQRVARERGTPVLAGLRQARGRSSDDRRPLLVPWRVRPRRHRESHAAHPGQCGHDRGNDGRWARAHRDREVQGGGWPGRPAAALQRLLEGRGRAPRVHPLHRGKVALADADGPTAVLHRSSMVPRGRRGAAVAHREPEGGRRPPVPAHFLSRALEHPQRLARRSAAAAPAARANPRCI